MPLPSYWISIIPYTVDVMGATPSITCRHFGDELIGWMNFVVGLTYFSIGRTITGTEAFSLKRSASVKDPMPSPTCMGIATLGWMATAASTASSYVMTLAGQFLGRCGGSDDDRIRFLDQCHISHRRMVRVVVGD
jgi:hypothetical protein